MAGRLIRPMPRRALALALLLALLGHLLALIGLALAWKTPATLQPFAAPLLTRQIVPGVAASVPNAAKVRAKSASNAINSVANKTPSPAGGATPTLASPQPAELAPAPVPAALPAPSASAAMAAMAAASAPSPAETPLPDASAAVALATLARWPADTRLSYRLGGNFRGELHGDAQVLWQREGERYQVRVSVSIGWLASVVMTSQGRVLPEGLHPLAYEESVRGARRTVELGESQLIMADGQRLPRPPRVQDTASQFVELTWRFLSGQTALEPGTAVRFWLARPGGADEWIYDVVGLETLATRLGPLPAWHMVPRPLAKPRGNITAEMWFAPGLQYLPARIKMNLGPDAHVDLVLDKVEQR